jgi:hypothetical protein
LIKKSLRDTGISSSLKQGGAGCRQNYYPAIKPGSDKMNLDWFFVFESINLETRCYF